MKKFDVVIALEGVHEAKQEWAKRITEFNSGVDAVMSRLLHEAARNYMSAEEVAKASGFTVKRIRQMMRDIGLNPRDGKRALSQTAAEALAENSALLGIEPHEMDLMSPLAYLKMGTQLKRELQDRTISQVHEVSGNEPFSTGVWCLVCGYFEMADDISDGWCRACGCSEESHERAAVVTQ